MQRVCFLLKVRPDRLDEYAERHSHVWPEMLEALSSTGWTNYSLFLKEDGLLVGYLETEDFAAAQAGMEAEPVNALWQAQTGNHPDKTSHGVCCRLFRQNHFHQQRYQQLLY